MHYLTQIRRHILKVWHVHQEIHYDENCTKRKQNAGTIMNNMYTLFIISNTLSIIDQTHTLKEKQSTPYSYDRLCGL